LERIDPQGLELKEKVVHISRVAKVVKGGRRFSFSALIVVGDNHSVVGYGMGKANEVPPAVEKAVKDAGLFRLEGKDYVIQDGDVVHFRFNV